jgi:hypothetical protein
MSFTYIIRSNNRENKDEDTASCHIRLQGLPQNFKYFECEVVRFYVSIDLNELIELRADSALGFQNSVDTNNGFKTCAFKAITIATHKDHLNIYLIILMVGILNFNYMMF